MLRHLQAQKVAAPEQAAPHATQPEAKQQEEPKAQPAPQKPAAPQVNTTPLVSSIPRFPHTLCTSFETRGNENLNLEYEVAYCQTPHNPGESCTCRIVIWQVGTKAGAYIQGNEYQEGVASSQEAIWPTDLSDASNRDIACCAYPTIISRSDSPRQPRNLRSGLLLGRARNLSFTCVCLQKPAEPAAPLTYAERLKQGKAAAAKAPAAPKPTPPPAPVQQTQAPTETPAAAPAGKPASAAPEASTTNSRWGTLSPL